MGRAIILTVITLVVMSAAIGWWALHADWRSQSYNGTVTATSGFFYPVTVNKVTIFYYHSDLTLLLSNGQTVKTGTTSVERLTNPFSVGELVCAIHNNATGWSVDAGTC